MLGLSLLTLSTTPILAQTGRFLPLPSTTITTVPTNGDVNPYGIGGRLQPADVLVSNFGSSGFLVVMGRG
jgi:hypothetical protein